MFFDPMFFLFVGPVMLFSAWASYMTKSRFKKYSKIASDKRITGAEAARIMLQENDIHDVGIERVQGFLSDHYDPRHKMLRLSPGVHDSPSLAAVGVACHEVGHAIQHARHYLPLHLRSTMVPATMITSKMAMPLIFLGLILSRVVQTEANGGIGYLLLLVGIGAFSLSVIFSVVTLPVEWDATARAKRQMVSAGIVSNREADDAARVLNAAFLTYLAAAASAVMTLLYYLWRAGLIGGRRN